MKRFVWGTLATTLLGTTALSPAFAQDEAAVTVLDPIIITARKAEENVKDVPFAVTVLPEQELIDRRVEDAHDIFLNVPNGSMVNNGDGRSSFGQIRGVGSIGFPASFDDSSVVTYENGIPKPMFGADAVLFDLERVEVLKGPQGTLFGRNSMAGAVNLITRKPTGERELTMGFELGTDLARRTELVASGPLVEDTLYGRFAAVYQGLDGFIPNDETGKDVGGFDTGAFRGTLLFAPTGGATEATLTIGGERSKFKPYYLLWRDSPLGERVYQSDPDVRRDQLSASLNVKHDFGGVVFNSDSSIQHLDTHRVLDTTYGYLYGAVTGLPPEFFGGTGNITDWKEDQLSLNQEFRLSSAEDSAIQWTTGLNFYRDAFDVDYVNTSANPMLPPGNSGRLRQKMTNTGAALFGEATVPIVGGLKAMAGLRGTYEKKDMAIDYTDFTGMILPGGFQQNEEQSYSFLTGRAGLQYEWNEQATSYFTVGRGYKTGGYPRGAFTVGFGQPAVPYDSATSWTYEVGTKVDMLDGRLQLEVSAFYNDVSDEHVYQFSPLTLNFDVHNIDTRSYGAEVSGRFQIDEAFALSGGFGYTHAELVNVTPELALATGARNGGRVPDVPAVTANLSLEYRGGERELGAIGSASPFGSMTVQYIGTRKADIANTLELASFTNLSARVGLEFANGEAYLFATNLLDQDFETTGAVYSPTVAGVNLAPGRTIGLGAKLRF